ncbi:MAG: TRAP transporter TatT component family protein [Candidatus Marinimicrobia bacterium]|nr:TRAP transporter TatT component family protein [Candidatus Neomarinimicrobiota bacterium]
MEFKKVFLVLALSLYILTPLIAQISDVEITIECSRLSREERQDLRTLEMKIPGYFTNYEWFDNPYNIQMPIRINIFANSVNKTGNNRKFSGQMFVSTLSGDQRFLEKGMRFIYNKNQTLIHQEMISPLASIFDFYAYALLAGEMDTYELMGGDNLYEKARDIASRGQYSNYSEGWAERLKELNKILDLPEYRRFKFYFWKIIDLENKGETTKIPENIDLMLENLESAFDINSSERNTTIFLNARKEALIGLLLDYGTKEQRQKLIELNSQNKKFYQNKIEEYKK